MPDLGTTESSVAVLNWLVESGERIERGQPLLEVETDKTTLQVEAVASGRIESLLVEPGENVETGTAIAVIDTENAGTAEPPRRGMFARNREARSKESGNAAANSTKTSETTEGSVPLSGIQRVAARRLSESKHTIPHFYIEGSAGAESMRRIREASDPHPVWDAFFVRAAARAVERYDRFYYRYTDDGLVASGTRAIGVAVDINNELFVVGIDDPARKTVTEISEEIRAGVAGIEGGSGAARKLPVVNLTVSNLGGSGVDRFTGVINPPEAAIVAVGRVNEVPVVVDGKIEVEARVAVTISVDHRLVNGKYAAAFLKSMIVELEEPSDE